MKTVTVTKPVSAKSTKSAPKAKVTKPVVKVAPKAKAKSAAKAHGKGIYFFQFTPAGRLLRAYFIAMITAQTGGKLQSGVQFKLWPHANIRGHLLTGKIERKETGFALTQSGFNYFSDPKQQPDADAFAGMLHAVTTGEKPKFYPHELTALK